MKGGAIALSFLAPGSGQLLLGRTVRGIVIAAIAFVLPLLIPVAGVWAMFAWIAMRPIAAIEAAIGPVAPSHSLGAGLSAVGQVLGVVLVRLFVVEGFRASSPSMEPTLHTGDHLLVDKVSAISRGDIVVFDDPCGGGTEWLKRAVALGGDTVELRCGILYVNGTALPQVSLGPYTYDQPGETKTERVRAARYREGDHEILLDEQRPSLDLAHAIDYLEVADAHDFPPLEGPAGGCTAPLTFERTIDRPAHACDPQLHYTVPPGDVFVLGDNRESSVDSRTWGAFPASRVRGRYVATWMHR